MAREGFRLLTWNEPFHRATGGFLYGYRGRAGRWWYDTVTRALAPEARERWFRDPLEVVSMAVDPAFRERGYGGALLRRTLELVPERTVVLSTYRDENPAVRLYAREGLVTRHPGLSLAPGSAPMLILGRDAVGGPSGARPG